MSTVADAMLRSLKLSGPDSTVADLRALFTDDHVHAALVVDGGRLVAVVERGDLGDAADDQAASELGRLQGRCVNALADLETTRERMVAGRIRRLAVVNGQGMLLGLLCLKRSGEGFCSDADVSARSSERDQRSG